MWLCAFKIQFTKKKGGSYFINVLCFEILIRSIVRSSIDPLTADDSMSSLPALFWLIPHYNIGRAQITNSFSPEVGELKQVLPPSLLFNGQYFLYISAFIVLRIRETFTPHLHNN